VAAVAAVGAEVEVVAVVAVVAQEELVVGAVEASAALARIRAERTVAIVGAAEVGVVAFGARVLVTAASDTGKATVLAEVAVVAV